MMMMTASLTTTPTILAHKNTHTVHTHTAHTEGHNGSVCVWQWVRATSLEQSYSLHTYTSTNYTHQPPDSRWRRWGGGGLSRSVNQPKPSTEHRVKHASTRRPAHAGPSAA